MSDMNAYPIPADIDMEEEVVVSMLMEKDVIAETAEMLKPEHFYNPKFKKLYQGILERWEENIDSVNLVDMVPFLEQLDITIERISEVAVSIPSYYDNRRRADRLIRLADMRQAMKIGHQLITAGHQWHTMDREAMEKVIADAGEALGKIGENEVKKTMRSVHDILMEYTDKVERTLWDNGEENEQLAPGLLSDLEDLDKLTNGYQAPELIIVAARPSIGKTAYMNQQILNISQLYPDKGAIGIFSLEMSSEALVQRMLSNLGNLSGLGTRKLNDEEYSKFTMAVGLLANRNIAIDDEAGQTVAKIKAKARRLQKEKGLATIFIDYLQFIEPPAKGMSRADAVSANTKALKNMAKELGVPVVALAQVGRQVEQRADKRPMMSDLRESGEIEQTADKIMFLYRDDYYDRESEKRNILEVILAKNRDGATGLVELAFLREYGKILNLEVQTSAAEQMACV
ncbi:replicative DNA helicase [Aneurinibacillus sp. REN35]|uniref:replicative DNA helicase n=2 Tax=Paenibacillaceae TaxID=186822 RepID=UPI00352807C9